MALHRMISTSLWTDPCVQFDMTSDDMLMFLFLLTNPLTSVTGVYEIDIRYAAQQTKLGSERAMKAIEHLEELGRIEYCADTREVFIVNWAKNNWTRSPKLESAVRKALTDIKSDDFRRKVEGMCNQNSDDDANEPEKRRYGTYSNVLLTGDERWILAKEYPNHADDLIDRLSEYIESKGARYNNHFATLRSWAKREGIKASGDEKSKNYAFCPECGSHMWRNNATGRFDCGKCFKSFAKGDLGQ